MTKQELKEKANGLPLSPGVYIMMDAQGTVIYVGKAKKLKNRVSQYFQETSGHNEKTRRMVSKVDHFDTIIASSEFEALILENALIKQYMPRYNILLKDDKGYPFVRLSLEAEYPTFSLSNTAAEDGAKYFGPFGGRTETKAAIAAICSALRLPTCHRRFPRDIGKERPCLNFHMGKCDGFCRGTPGKEEYHSRIEQAVLLLTGKVKQVTASLSEEMTAAAEALQFERAAALRDQISAIDVLSKKQKVIAGAMPQTDIWGLYRGEVKSCYAVLHYRDGQLTDRETEVFSARMDEQAEEMLPLLLAQYYLRRSVLPREIWLPMPIEDPDVMEQALSQHCGGRVLVRIPRRGEKADLIRLANRNAREEAERVTSEAERASKTLELLAKMTGLSAPPRRMESYDISNTGSSDIVASMVVYEGTRPRKSAYRKFHIKSLSAPDDYRSMEEVLTRRLQRYVDGDEKFAPLPDVFLIDGGANHAKVAERVLAAFGLSVPVFGMVKDDRHRTRALITAAGHEIGIQASEPVFALIGQIQEETHRFAVAYHHQRHTKSSYRSALDGIPGVGAVRKKQLLKAFGTVKAVREADEAALARVVPAAAARAVYAHFHEKSEERTEDATCASSQERPEAAD